MRISLKQDATSPSLHNFYIPPLRAPITFLSRSGTSSLIILSNYNIRFYDLTKSRSANFVKNLISFFLGIIAIRIESNFDTKIILNDEIFLIKNKKLHSSFIKVKKKRETYILVNLIKHRTEKKDLLATL